MGNKDLINNYRPLLPFLSKIYENFTYNTLYNYWGNDLF